MKPRTKPVLFIFILVLLVHVSSFPGGYGSSESAVHDRINPHFKVVKQQGIRKLLNVNVLDYHDPGANPGHDPPGKGKGSGGPPHN